MFVSSGYYDVLMPALMGSSWMQYQRYIMANTCVYMVMMRNELLRNAPQIPHRGEIDSWTTCTTQFLYTRLNKCRIML